MHWLNTSYAAWFNRRHQRAGPLFQGVYKAILVEPSNWGLALSRYVHLIQCAPWRWAWIRGPGGPTPWGCVGGQKADWWNNGSSNSAVLGGVLPAYIGLDRGPAWLECRRVWDFNGRGSEKRFGAVTEADERELREMLNVESNPYCSAKARSQEFSL
jgi:hypothetical protein